MEKSICKLRSEIKRLEQQIESSATKEVEVEKRNKQCTRVNQFNHCNYPIRSMFVALFFF